jgi:hypothetical protein
LANDCVESLATLISHCRTNAATSYTPSDFPEAELSQEELDKLVASFADLAD